MERIKKYAPGLIVLLIALVAALAGHNDYGISWDEPLQREIGEVSYNYIFKKDTVLNSFADRDHGTGFELPLIMLEKDVLHQDMGHSRQIYLTRHLVSHLFFLICAFCGYLLFLRLYRNQFLAVLGLLMLLLCPRIYAHSFINSKDIPFLGMFLPVFLFAHLAFDRDKWGWYLLLGLACGYATSIRILGIIPTGIFCVFFLADGVMQIRSRKRTLMNCLHFSVFAASAFIAIYIAWPTLWGDPVRHFIQAYQSLSHFRWENSFLFDGHMADSTNLPWYYLPYWILISLPLVWLVLGIAGIFTVIMLIVTRPLQVIRNTRERHFLLYFLCLVIPIASVILLKSVVYDDWRHVYFVYPSLVLMALFVAEKLMQTGARNIVRVLCGVQALCTLMFMMANHPFQQVYFNRLVSHGKDKLIKSFDYEYWGCAYKDALDYVLAHDTAAQVRVFESLNPVRNAWLMQTPEQQKRVVLVNRNERPFYFINNFRSRPNDFIHEKIFYEIRVQNSPIVRVYKVGP